MKLALAIAFVTITTTPSHAESWCAEPLVVQEWGVHVFGTGRVTTPDPDLRFFHTPTHTRAAAPQVPVRTLPADNGVRKLPVLHFFSDRGGDIPVAIEVGFKDGTATHWWPDVDVFDPQAARELEWQRLDLSRAPRGKTGAMPAWADVARAIPDALWVNLGSLAAASPPGTTQPASPSERFVFYEGSTSERVPLSLTRGAEWKRGHRHFLLKNTGLFAVHDVMFMHREGGRPYLFVAPTIPAGASVSFVLEDHATKPEALPATLRAMLVVAPGVAVTGECVMGRDPSKPMVHASGSRLYPGVVDLLLSAWSQRFFGGTATTETKVVYREDNAYLAQQMPLAVYTDMYSYVVLSRLSLALWEGVVLP